MKKSSRFELRSFGNVNVDASLLSSGQIRPLYNPSAIERFKHHQKEIDHDTLGIRIRHPYFGLLSVSEQRRMNVVNELDNLREKINSKGQDAAVQKLVTLMKSLKDLERQENHFQSSCDAKHSEIQAEISDLEGKLANGCDSQSLLDGLHHSLSESLERLNSAEKKLAARLRAVVAIKRQIDEVPCQSEIIQYEHRFSELNAHIQGKHRQTRKCYATYNALLEIKELMLKETSLLNSIISQFQEAFSSPDGRTKLINSMEGIVKGSKQKLEKVQLGLQEEERNLNDLKEKYAAAVGSQKRCYSLMKTYQEHCANNQKLGSQSLK
ncbi:coiled-coil domain-containing protein 93 [Senna tora]|uniref:Coiled-coil domain-containing protein 93 n=1 Tax=Senna tora TaxID=362788 RepID=A0A834WSL1_9FABA|nr:coiled-coil domain-containing protein 93 [Senna tora]